MALSSLRVTGETCEELPSLHRFFMWHASRELCPPGPAPGPAPRPRADMTKGPRGTDPRGPSFRQHRRQGSAGAWERRRGVAPLACRAPASAPGGHRGARRASIWSEPLAVGGDGTPHSGSEQINMGEGGAMPLSPAGLGAFYASCWMNAAPATVSPSSYALLPFPPAGPERPRGRPFSWVTGPLSPAVRSLPRSEVPRRTARSVRLIAPGEPRVVLPGPPLAGTDIGTNEAVRVPVTRRTGERAAELRCDHGRVRGGSWRGGCRACRGPAGSDRGSPSRGTGSRDGRRR